jgi:hypothetical protein
LQTADFRRGGEGECGSGKEKEVLFHCISHAMYTHNAKSTVLVCEAELLML